MLYKSIKKTILNVIGLLNCVCKPFINYHF